MGREATAAVYFLGSIIAVVFFGLRWFTSTGDIKKGATAGAWPPTINYCPDFLTLATIDGEQVCIDTVGVSQSGGMSTSDGTQVGDIYMFHLYLDETGHERVTSLCSQAKEKQVTWEGVWDGTTCLGAEPPKPSPTG